MRPSVRRGIAGPRRRSRVPVALALLAGLAAAACEGPPSGGADRAGRGDPPSSGAVPNGRSAAAVQEEATERRFEVSDLGVNAGSPDAPVQVVEFSDFGCPHCREFHDEVYPLLHEEYVESGKVIWKYVPFVLGVFPNSVEAARAGECAIEQGAFAPMRDRLFEAQDRWTSSDGPIELFVRFAREEGLDADRFRACVTERWREERLLRSLEIAENAGVDRTPTFFVQERRLEGARSAEFFRELFDGLVDGRDPTGEGDAS